jgi:hypothetical protein
VARDSLEKRLRQIEALAGEGVKRPLTVFSETPGEYFTLQGEARVPVSRKELLRLKSSTIVTLVVLRLCRLDAEETGLPLISVVSENGMMLAGRVLAGERTERVMSDGKEKKNNEDSD